jgi:hypothetical protein
MTIPISFADHGRESWREALPLGLPVNFNFRNIRTGDDAFHFIFSFPNAQRGVAAKLLYEHRHIVGNRIAFRGLMEAWNHDHAWVLSAFGSGIAFAAALRDVNPARKTEARIIAWRGVDNVNAALGLSWTTMRGVACWFAVRSPRKTPFVFRCELHPEDVVARYNGRCEHELIVDPLRMDLSCVSLDDPSKEFETYACDIVAHEDVSPAAIADWRIASNGYAAFIKAKTDRLMRKARGRK